eukprot:8773480-Pyramimonas_sp.AAC.1
MAETAAAAEAAGYPPQDNQFVNSPLGEPRTLQGGPRSTRPDAGHRSHLLARREKPLRAYSPPFLVSELLMDSEPQAPSSGVQGTTGKASCAPAMEAAPPSVRAPGTTS